MTKARDFAMMVGRSEAINPTRVALLDGDAVTVADSATVSSIVGNVGTAVYDSLGALPVAGLTAGQQAFVSANNRLYISNGNGWYNVATINATPTLTTSPTGTIALAAGSATVVTMTAADSYGTTPALSLESGGDLFKFATVSRDSSVVTITPRSEDSAISLGSDGSATLTFKASDGIGVASVVNTFTLSFGATYSNKLSSTDYAIGTSGTTFETSVKKQGTHSYYAVGNGVTSRNPGANSASAVTYNDWTISFWFYINTWNSYNSNLMVHLFCTNDKLGPGYSFGTKGNSLEANGDYWFATDNYNGSNYGGNHGNVGGSVFSTGVWYHLVFSGSTTGPTIGTWITREGQSFGNVLNRETFGGHSAVATRVSALKIGGTDGLYIHGSNGTASDGGNVYYDDFRVYNAKATAANAQAIFNSAGDVTDASNPLQSNLKLAYTFDNTANSI